MKRILTRHVVLADGSKRDLSVVSVADDGSVSVEPYTRETAGTTFHSGTIRIIGSMPENIVFEP